MRTLCSLRVATGNQQVIKIDVIEVKMGVYSVFKGLRTF